MTTNAVEIAAVSKNFAGTRVLDDISIDVREHEFVSLLGPSGCGKSTLLRIVSGFESATSGVVRVAGRDVTSVPPHRRPTNIVFQRGALFPHMNVFDNIAYSLRLKRLPRARIADKVEEMLALVRMEGFASRGATELSGGQVQRVALAMDSRAFGAHSTRTERHLVPFRTRDTVFTVATLLASAAIFVVSFPWQLP